MCYLMSNPFLYIYTALFQTIQFSTSIVFVYTLLNAKIVLFQIIQLNIRTQFSSIRPYQVLPLRARVNPEATAWKGYSAFQKAPVLPSEYLVITRTLIGGEFYPSAEVQSVCCTALAGPTDNGKEIMCRVNFQSTDAKGFNTLIRHV